LKVFVVQDKLFRVWGKLFLEREDMASYFGRFEPMPDFVYLSAKFEEYEELLNQNRGEITQTGELNKWVVSLRPKLVSSEGEEVELIGAYVSFLERAPALTFHGNKMFIEDLNTQSGSND